METTHTSYDEVPYESRPMPQSHPDNLGTIAHLYGIPAKPADRARVLEIGCATGGNLLPMAVSYPNAEFLGIDLARTQIDYAREVAKTIGIPNTRFEVANALELPDSFGGFDYILCHGVFSWIRKADQITLLRSIANRLNSGGIAFVSFNVIPGWYYRQSTRDVLRYRFPSTSDPAKVMKQVRELLADIGSTIKEQSFGRGQAVRDELETLSKCPDFYVFHEHMEAENHPIFFHEMMSLCSEAGLAYVAETPFCHTAENADGNVGAFLDKWSRDRLDREQLCDFVTSRPFRRSIFCRADQPISKISSDRVGGKRISATSRPVSESIDLKPGVPLELENEIDHRIVVTDPAVKAMLVSIGEIYPRSLAVEEVPQRVAEILKLAQVECPIPTLEEFQKIILQLYQSFMLFLHGTKPNLVTELSATPTACPLARLSIERQLCVPTRRHKVADLENFDLGLMQLLDGTRTRKQIEETVLSQLRDGSIKPSGPEGESPEVQLEVLESQLLGRLDYGLRLLAQRGLIIA